MGTKKKERRAVAGLESWYRGNRNDFLTPKESSAPVRYLIDDTHATFIDFYARSRGKDVHRSKLRCSRASEHNVQRDAHELTVNEKKRKDLRPRRDTTSPSRRTFPLEFLFARRTYVYVSRTYLPTRCLTLSLPVSPIVGTLFLHLQIRKRNFRDTRSTVVPVLSYEYESYMYIACH